MKYVYCVFLESGEKHRPRSLVDIYAERELADKFCQEHNNIHLKTQNIIYTVCVKCLIEKLGS